MSEAKYRVEVAKTGRSICKASKEKIEKGELRFGTFADIMGHGGYQWRKLGHITSRLARNVEAKVGGPKNVAGVAELTDAQQKQFNDAFALALEGSARVSKAAAKAKTRSKACSGPSVGLKSERRDDVGEAKVERAETFGIDASGAVDLLVLLTRAGIPERATSSYATLLAEKGFDCVSALLTLTDEDLEHVGMLTGHRRLLLRHVSSDLHSHSRAQGVGSSRSAIIGEGAFLQRIKRSRSRRLAEETGLDVEVARDILRESDAVIATQGYTGEA